MPKRKEKISSAIGWSTPDRINVHGLDLPSEVLGHVNLGDMAFMQVTGRRPTEQESRVFNAMAVTLVEHGITPSALVARLTYMGAPESLQAAVAAGLCGLGTVFVGSMEGASRMLYAALPKEKAGTGADLEEIARRTVEEHRAARRIVSGLGHPVHKPVDPRTPRLFEIAAENGMSGDYVALMKLIEKEAQAASGKALPINATGAIGAICCEFGFPQEIIRGFGVMARAIGLVGHILEETRNPMAFEIWQRAEEEILETSGPDAG
jgi:citrate synthase